MARRRMFSKDIVNSARFLKLPPMSRLLYYDLGMAADDDGVVEAYTVLATTGAEETDLRLLEQRGFISILNEDMVSYITDWKINNQIRKDRYTPSVHQNLIQIDDGNQMATNGQPNGNQWSTQYRLGEDSLGQDSLGQSRLVEDRADTGGAGAPLPYPPTEENVAEYIKKNGLKVDGWRFYRYYSERHWLQSNGKPLRQWGKRLERWNEDERNAKSAPEAKSDEQIEAEREQREREMARLLERLNREENEQC